MGRTVLAIDIQHRYLAGVLMGRGLKGVYLSGAAVCPMPDDEAPDLKPGLDRILAQLGNAFDRCVVGLPADRFFFRSLALPFDTHKKIAQVIDMELENYLPLHAGEFESDFCLLKKDPADPVPAGTRRVSVAGIKKTDLDLMLTDFEALGRVPDGITVGTGYAEALIFAGTTEPAAVSMFVHVQPSRVAIYLIRFRQIVFCRCAVLDPQDPAEGVVRHLSHTLPAFNDRFGSREPVTAAGVSGSMPVTAQVADLLKEKLALKVALFDAGAAAGVRQAIDPGADMEYTAWMTGNAVAMAVNEIKGRHGFDFNRRMSGFTRVYRENRAGVWVAVVLAVLVILAGSVRPFLDISRVQARVQAMDQRIAGVFYKVFPENTPMVEPVRQIQVKLEELREKHPAEFMDGHPLNIDVLHGVSTRLPPDLDIVLTRFVRMENNLTVTGSADLFNTVDKMKTHLETVPGFRAVEINSAALDKTDNRVRFSLRILLGPGEGVQ